MRTILKSSFLWQFAGGFVLGAAGLLVLQPAANASPVAPAAISAPVR